MPTAPALAAVMAEGSSGQQLAIGEETGLPFIGYTYKRLYTICLPHLSILIHDSNLCPVNISRRAAASKPHIDCSF